MERNIKKKPAQHIPTSLEISCILLRLSPICQIMYCCVVLDLPLMATNTSMNLKVCLFITWLQNLISFIKTIAVTLEIFFKKFKGIQV